MVPQRNEATDGPFPNGKDQHTVSLEKALQTHLWLGTFTYGSLWTLGENLVKVALRWHGYDQKSTREGHPGICTKGLPADAGIHAMIQMWYGTSNRTEPSYQVRNFYGDDKEHTTFFGYFKPFSVSWDAERLSGKDGIRPNWKRKLTSEERNRLDGFFDHYMLLNKEDRS